MHILKILTYPHPALRQKSKVVDLQELKDKKLRAFCLSMAKTMLKKEGVGLAASQVGKNIRLNVINIKGKQIIMINPKIVKKSLLKEWGEEGCLSVPDTFGDVKRHKKITCCYFDLDKKENKIKAEGLLARVIQHEIDHLDGILFIDKAKDIKHVTHNT